MWNLIIKEEAVSDIADTANWYEEKKTGLGLEFIEETELSISLIQSNPQLFQAQYRNLRFGYINRFPYLIVYEIEKKQIIIFAVLHLHQNPKKRDKK